MVSVDATRHVTLVAMPRSGEVFIVRDNRGEQWLISPPGAGDPQRVDDEVVERAIVDHGFARIEESFVSWAALDDDRQRRAGIGLTATRLEVDGFDAEDIRQLMRALHRSRERGEIPRARRVAHRLLSAPVLHQDLDLFRGLVEFLEELDAIRAPSPASVADDDPERAPARQRVLTLAA